jgi:hypothetical protein
MQKIDYNFIDTTLSFGENSEGLVIQKSQEIPDSFLSALKQERFDNSQHFGTNEYHRRASIPVAIVEKWLKEGFDVFQEPVAKSVARLKLENLDYFITSDK